ncbi:lipopolysaccharide biosynthesis protein [Leuconostoc mesenteroides]|uniref:lipopolysaccharide biosynthesis protein n=1 Tax=Leuconostoc mesenteroides TaxID=1245 RepID=UPI0021820FF0|nr:hypothetical protein [Leuconostoc mesenteroides]MCS8586191.1 hypothetical protein [Leuconostoc mesenteroides]
MFKNDASKNALAAGVFFVIYTVLQFVNRSFFSHQLGAEYLGVNGLISNLVGMLAIADLGIASAANFSLYAPVARKDNATIVALLALYHKIYAIIVFVIGLFGVLVGLFLPYITKTPLDIRIPFMLLTLNTIISYFGAARRSLIVSHQQDRKASFADFTGNFIVVVGQIVFLVLAGNYTGYLVIRVIGTLITNVLIYVESNPLMPMATTKTVVDQSIKKELFSNVIGNFFLRMSGIVVTGTDNILISLFANLTTVGLYSNYLLVVQTVQSLITQVFNAIISTIAKRAIESNKSDLARVFLRMQFVNFVIVLVVATGFMSFFTWFINLWVGSKFLLPHYTLFLIALSFFFMNYNITSWGFTSALGLAGRFKRVSVFEMVANLGFSELFGYVFKQGLNGIIMGTITSTVVSVGWMNAYIIFKYGFNHTPRMYYKNMLINTFIFIFTIYCSEFVTRGFAFNESSLWVSLVKFIGSLMFEFILIITFYHKADELRYLGGRLKKMYIK